MVPHRTPNVVGILIESPQPQAVRAARRAILAIIRERCDEETKRAALGALTSLTHTGSAAITDNRFSLAAPGETPTVGDDQGDLNTVIADNIIDTCGRSGDYAHPAQL